MIPLNQEQHLGKEAYYLMISRRMTAGAIILILSGVILALKPYIAGFLAGLIAAAGRPVHSASVLASSIIGGIVLGTLILALVLFVVGIILARFQYSNYTFTFEEFDLRLKRGIIATSVTSIPYRQMQDINIERGLTHRLTKTSRVVIDSAGQDEKGEQSDSDIILDPIGRDMAEDIRLMLQRKIGIQVVQGEKQADLEATTETAAPDQAASQ